MDECIFPKEICEIIIKVLLPDPDCPIYLIRSSNIRILALVCRDFHDFCSTPRKKIALYNKYNKFNKEYETPQKHWAIYFKENDPKWNPQLLDACFTGCVLPYSQQTFYKYTIEIEEDIKTIIDLMPESLNCNLGSLRCRDFVTPLHVACANINIPLHIIELMLKKGANPESEIILNNYPISIMEDINNIGIPPERLDSIKKLFKDRMDNH